jgi:hypothetical protein
MPPRAVEQSFEPHGVKRSQIGVQSEQGIATGQLLTVAERKLCGHVGWVPIYSNPAVMWARIAAFQGRVSAQAER